MIRAVVPQCILAIAALVSACTDRSEPAGSTADGAGSSPVPTFTSLVRDARGLARDAQLGSSLGAYEAALELGTNLVVQCEAGLVAYDLSVVEGGSETRARRAYELLDPAVDALLRGGAVDATTTELGTCLERAGRVYIDRGAYGLADVVLTRAMGLLPSSSAGSERQALRDLYGATHQDELADEVAGRFVGASTRHLTRALADDVGRAARPFEEPGASGAAVETHRPTGSAPAGVRASVLLASSADVYAVATVALESDGELYAAPLVETSWSSEGEGAAVEIELAEWLELDEGDAPTLVIVAAASTVVGEGDDLCGKSIERQRILALCDASAPRARCARIGLSHTVAPSNAPECQTSDVRPWGAERTFAIERGTVILSGPVPLGRTPTVASGRHSIDALLDRLELGALYEADHDQGLR